MCLALHVDSAVLRMHWTANMLAHGMHQGVVRITITPAAVSHMHRLPTLV